MLEVRAVERVALDLQHAEYIAPLAVGDLVSFPVPVQLAQDDALGRRDAHGWSISSFQRNLDGTTDLLFVEPRSRTDEYVHLQVGLPVDDVEGTLVRHGVADHL